MRVNLEIFQKTIHITQFLIAFKNQNKNTLYRLLVHHSAFRTFEVELERFQGPDCYFSTLSKLLKKKRDYLAKVLKEAGMDPVVPDGGYFIMADWSKFGKREYKLLRDFELISSILRYTILD